MSVQRFDPFRELDRLSEAAWSRARGAGIPFDAIRRDREVELRFDLPGVDPESIDVTVEKGALAVMAERNADQQDGETIVVSGRPMGRFSRQVRLGDGLETDNVQASYEAGVLRVVVPLAEEILPRKVPVQVSVAAEQVAA